MLSGGVREPCRKIPVGGGITSSTLYLHCCFKEFQLTSRVLCPVDSSELQRVNVQPLFFIIFLKTEGRDCQRFTFVS
jgi:hypothetical protein